MTIPLKVNSEETHCLHDHLVAYEYSNELFFLKIHLERNMQDQRGIVQHKTIIQQFINRNHSTPHLWHGSNDRVASSCNQEIKQIFSP